MTHPNRARLLAYLDGELPLAERPFVKLHLLRCWSCRAACDSLEAGAHRFTRALAEPASPRARARFEAWRWRYEQSQASVEPARSWRRLVPLLFALPVVMVGLLAAFRLSAPHETIAPHGASPAVPDFAWAVPSPLPSVTPAVEPVPIALELDVHYRVHRIGVCAAEPVLILKKPHGPIEVSVLAPPPQREREIRLALSELVSAKRIQLRVTPAPEGVLLADGVGAPASKAPISPAMLESEIPGRFANFSQAASTALAEADRLYANAWALKRHQELVIPAESQDSNAFWLKHSMVNDHLKELRRSLAAIERELAPIRRTSPVVERLKHKPVFDLASQFNTQFQHFLQAEAPGDLDAQAPGSDELWATLQALEIQLTLLERNSSAAHPR